jgi:DNA-binding MarR family transcriptional regulator
MFMESGLYEKTVEAVEEQAEELVRRLDLLSGNRGAENISLGQYRVMAVIHAHGTISVGMLGKLVGSAQSTTSEMVARMTKTGLVSKVRGPDDGRVVLVELTEQGRELMVHRKKGMQDAYGKLLTALEPDDKRKFVDSLWTINDILAAADFE